ncbi:SRPBCC family protein [Kribbella sp. NBC_01245]|uniref:SRPBCC family protein n=1 Tax=Kribbella sp. NBC_01245 TaxID=2903578 RepID=UPI002E2B5EBB|nr:SRPBCC family protein [Kribbella sp. NBC_01245]
MSIVRRITAAAVLASLASTSLLPAAGATGRAPGQDVGIDLQAPVITRDDVLIKAPLAAIWKIQTDVEGWPAWQPEVVSAVRQDEGRLKPGSVFRWEVQGLDVTSTVKQVKPMRRLVWGGPANGITAVHVWTFTPVRGGVLVHTEESWSGDPVEANVEFAQSALDASLHAWLQNLKQTAEVHS